MSHGTFYYEIQLTPFNGGEGYLLRLKNVTELENMRTELTFTKLRLEQREIFLGKYKDILDRVQMLTGPGEIKENSDFQATLRDTREALQKLVATLNEE